MQMISFHYLINKIKDVKIKDYFSVFPMITALILKPFYRERYQGTWLICEEPYEARDNGYHFFRYMCERQPQQKCYYAVKKESVDAKKVQKIGLTVEYGSIQHWLAYFLCAYNISSQKGGKPNPAMCAFMEMNGVCKPRNVFLQHGITKDMAEWLFADKCNFYFFITAAIPEHNMIKDYYGYKDGVARLTGFPRYDSLIPNQTNQNQILIMPTWRNWFNLKSKGSQDVKTPFGCSEYLKKWMELLNSKELDYLIINHNLKVVFFLHRNMQRYIEAFQGVNEKIVIASWKDYDIQELLLTSKLMITDYSSVFFDMVYMKKPVIFYQFDEEEYRKYQYQQGWFDYHSNAFGTSYSASEEVIEALSHEIENGYKVSERYLNEYSHIFAYSDRRNSRRIYELLDKEKSDM